MKTIGLIGGMSWESTVTYYQQLNRLAAQHLGGLHSAKILLHSLDFGPIEALQRQGKWQEMAEILANAAAGLERAGAELMVIGTNTMHKVAEPVQNNINIPLIHIATATGETLKNEQITKVALLGTRYTMEMDFYKNHLTQHFGIEVLIPDEAGRQLVNDVIFNELVKGKIRTESRQQYLQIIEQLHSQGAQGVILGCTEIALLVEPQHTHVPLFDTVTIHCQQIMKRALAAEV